MSSSLVSGLEFTLAQERQAHEPPEVRGSGRDDVRLMVSHVSDDAITHAYFHELPRFLTSADLLVVNSSATINAALNATRLTRGGLREAVRVHLSTPLHGARWVIELRRMTRKGTVPLADAERGERIELHGGGYATLLKPFVHGMRLVAADATRLWEAQLSLSTDALSYGDAYGFPIRYSYVPKPWPLSYYQTIFALEPGSAEMPSAGRPFTWELLHLLKDRGVRVAPIVLHAGVASLESDELPYPERFRVPHTTAKAVNETRASGNRVIAVGTTVVRALESVVTPSGQLEAGEGWTDVVVSSARGLSAVDAILTGFHAPRASHLSMLEALAGSEHLAHAYEAAIEGEYLWHEFGDVHLILPG